MLDDFSALDFLSVEGFNLATVPADTTRRKKKRSSLKDHKAVAGLVPKDHFILLFPLLGNHLRSKKKKKQKKQALQGWPVSLSWPTKETVPVDLWGDHGNFPLS